MRLVEEERLVELGTCRLYHMVSKADALHSMHVHTTRPLRYISTRLRFYKERISKYSQFKSLVFEDLEMTFHSWRSLSASHCAYVAVR